MNHILTVIFIISFSFAVFAQTEILTNSEIILMTKAGLSRELIIRKIKDSKGKYDVSTQSLIDLKKAGVSDEVIALMLDNKSASGEPTLGNPQGYSDSDANLVETKSTAHIIIEPKEALLSAKTIAIEKSSLNPSRQALEKELLKRQDWQKLNLNIVRYKEGADLLVEIGFVPLSVITHRYVFRVYDNKSGTVIAAGETTSWGSLAENLARTISKNLNAVLIQPSK
ncbi:MAG: hypothetical protein M3Q33_10760 [Acidobacteriota bacterium]|nr:hypothetical protein [Acidobacteriota bacterium]